MATLSKARVGRVLAAQGILIAFIVFMVVFTIANPKFLSVDNVLSVIRSSAILGVMALGVTFVVISGNLDLSVGSMCRSRPSWCSTCTTRSARCSPSPRCSR